MRSWQRLASALSLLLLAAMFPPAARANIDQPGALLVFPYVRVDPAQGIDTVIQIANTSDDETRLRCFLENANSHCQPSGAICQSTAQCSNGELCVPGWEVTSFLLALTARQPIGWQAGSGRTDLPLQENGDSIPAVPEQPFTGALRCIVVDPNGVPLGVNSLIGRAQITNAVLDDVVDAGSYNAAGFVAGSVDADGELILAPDGEYSSAAGVVELQFLYDGVADLLAGEGIHETTLVAVPASVDYATPASKPTTVQVAVYNEFETRLTTSFAIPAHLSRRISRLDSTNPASSIFSASVVGTATGQMRLSVVGQSGIVALAVEHRVDAEGVLMASVIRQPNALGARQTPDRISLVVPPTPTPPSTPTSTSTETAAATPTSTPADTATVAPTSSLTPTHSPGTPATPSPMPTHTAITSPTQTPTHTTAVSPTPSATPTHTETTPPTQSSTPALTITASPTSAAPTQTETVAPSPSETPLPCLGDCDGSGEVTVDELLKMVAIALGHQDVAFCRNGDRGDGLITVDEIVNAVQHALNGC